MNLPEWCLTHSLKEFMEMMNEPLAHNNQEGKIMNEHVNAPVADAAAPFSITESVEPIKHIVIKADGSQEWHDGAPAVEQAPEDEIRD